MFKLDFEIYSISLYSNIKAVPVGMSKGVKKLVKSKVPNLSRFDDVSDFLLRYILEKNQGSLSTWKTLKMDYIPRNREKSWNF